METKGFMHNLMLYPKISLSKNVKSRNSKERINAKCNDKSIQKRVFACLRIFVIIPECINRYKQGTQYYS